jgi:hypothetical protein
MAGKKEVTIMGANEQRFQIKNATDQEGAKFKSASRAKKVPTDLCFRPRTTPSPINACFQATCSGE